MEESHTYLPSLVELEDNLFQINLGDPSEKVIILTAERLNRVEELIHEVQAGNPAGLIITGNAGMFSAGADINVIGSTENEHEGEELALRGQRVFELIANLPCPVVAAISGPCVGGACELALACDYRLITDHPRSVIGLPEVKIGILPGFGGTQRLPRLIGLPESLAIILKGKTIKPEKALLVGLVDQIVTDEQLLNTAQLMLTKGKKGLSFSSKVVLKDKLITNWKFLRKIAAKQAEAGIQKGTKGFYPAPGLALEAILNGLDHGLEAGYQHEAKLLGKLIASPQCKALTNLFFLTEGAKGLGKSAKSHIKDLDCLVIGAGTMGAGIAGVLARAGFPVTLKDTKTESLTKGINSVRKTLSFSRSLSDTQKSAIIDRIATTTEYTAANQSANFVIEAIFEDLSLKQKVLGEAAGKISQNDQVIIASNTSSLSLTKIAEKMPQPKNTVGMHFFNPVDRMPLVEIVRAEQTSDETIVKVAALASKLNKYPIVVNDVPGFLINRILVPYLNEAAFLLSDGYKIEDIDQAALNFGLPMGPVRLLDEIGLDVAKHVGDTLVAGYGDRMKAPEYVKTLVDAGKMGKKSKLGFYNYAEKPETVDQSVYQALKISDSRPADLPQIEKRLIYSLINEAVLCLDEGVAGTPGADAAKQIDLGTIMGTGFPPFRGGLIYYADSLGAATIVQEMQKLERELGQRFRPAPGLFSRAERNTSFYE